MRTLMISFLLVSSSASIAVAQDDARTGEATVYGFEDEIVEGERFGTDVEIMRTVRRGARVSLIRARAHFVPEMLQSVERL